MEYSDVDSRRFGLNIYRASLPEIREGELFEQLVSNKVDVAILRFPTSQQHEISRLDRLGVPYIISDVLVYYESDLRALGTSESRNPELLFEPAGVEDHEVLNSLVTEIFEGYRNHYSSNPVLSNVDVLEGYCEWARGYCMRGRQGRWAWIVRDAGVPVAFVTCSEAEGGEEAEVVLNGVRPAAAGRGIYRDLISFVQRFFAQRGVPRLLISTQVQNVVVQKVWVRLDFEPIHSYLTAHMNAFLSHSLRPPERVAHSVSPSDAEAYGYLTSDMNPIHFDDEAAQSIGFESRIAHGIIVNGVASRFFGTVWPGLGCIFVGYTYRFLKPIYISRNYEIIITFPLIDESRGFAKALLRVVDETGDLCVLSYHDLRFGGGRQ
ncbi:unannotated protein [freshwater metagenome]|uniref:Unannotated protein n=1 Tax=freshwater metagenome TaxID=449393 RepID=A0A6J7G4V8_9ZZZZ|nr:hypothetical protein [Actinomycetota bacterium]